MADGFDTCRLAGPDLVADIDRRGCVLSDEDDGQTRRTCPGCRERLHANSKSFAQFRGQLTAIDDFCRQLDFSGTVALPHVTPGCAKSDPVPPPGSRHASNPGLRPARPQYAAPVEKGACRRSPSATGSDRAPRYPAGDTGTRPLNLALSDKVKLRGRLMLAVAGTRACRARS